MIDTDFVIMLLSIHVFCSVIAITKWEDEIFLIVSTGIYGLVIAWYYLYKSLTYFGVI